MHNQVGLIQLDEAEEFILPQGHKRLLVFYSAGKTRFIRFRQLGIILVAI